MAMSQAIVILQFIMAREVSQIYAISKRFFTFYYPNFENNEVGEITQYLVNVNFGIFSTVSVSLVNFTVQLATDKTALLEWKANFERNNYKFIIESTLDTANWENRS